MKTFDRSLISLLSKKISFAAIIVAAMVCFSGYVHAKKAAENPVQPLKWEVKSERQIALLSGGKTVWRFHADPAKNCKPYFDPLGVVGGPSLVLPKPADHPWHLAHWFSWKYINGVNYWEEDKRGVARGETFWETPEKELRPDGSAIITIKLGYRPRNKKSTPASFLLKEQRTIAISAPAPDGSYYLDWTQLFTAEKDVKLDRTPIPGEKGGVSFGGYAGLAVRFSNKLKDVRTVLTNTEKVRNRDREHAFVDVKGAEGAEQNGVIDGKEYGIAIFPHPNIPRSGDWYIIQQKNFTYLNPAFLLSGPFTLKAGETLTLRHRVYVHNGRWDKETLKKAALDYTQTTPAKK
ncbi:MAG: PmoA family protein [Puniceicoccales bacterium]|nr:PmoA family protein [Puniceicoccales bacterium]